MCEHTVHAYEFGLYSERISPCADGVAAEPRVPYSTLDAFFYVFGTHIERFARIFGVPTFFNTYTGRMFASVDVFKTVY